MPGNFPLPLYPPPRKNGEGEEERVLHVVRGMNPTASETRSSGASLVLSLVVWRPNSPLRPYNILVHVVLSIAGGRHRWRPYRRTLSWVFSVGATNLRPCNMVVFRMLAGCTVVQPYVRALSIAHVSGLNSPLRPYNILVHKVLSIAGGRHRWH